MSSQTKQRIVFSGLIAIMTLLATSCSSAFDSSNVTLPGDVSRSPAGVPVIIGSIIDPATAIVVKVPGKSHPVLMQSYSGAGN